MKSGLKVHEYFQKALYRSRDPLPPRSGEIIRGNDRLLAQFFLDVTDGRIRCASYKCSTCVVLVAYCERLTETITDLSLRDAAKITPARLRQDFPEIPPHRHDRASLAIRALHAALRGATGDRSMFIDNS